MFTSQEIPVLVFALHDICKTHETCTFYCIILKLSINSISYKSPTVYNMLPESYKHLSNYAIFKQTLNNYLELLENKSFAKVSRFIQITMLTLIIINIL